MNRRRLSFSNENNQLNIQNNQRRRRRNSRERITEQPNKTTIRTETPDSEVTVFELGYMNENNQFVKMSDDVKVISKETLKKIETKLEESKELFKKKESVNQTTEITEPTKKEILKKIYVDWMKEIFRQLQIKNSSYKQIANNEQIKKGQDIVFKKIANATKKQLQSNEDLNKMFLSGLYTDNEGIVRIKSNNNPLIERGTHNYLDWFKDPEDAFKTESAMYTIIQNRLKTLIQN